MSAHVVVCVCVRAPGSARRTLAWSWSSRLLPTRRSRFTIGEPGSLPGGVAPRFSHVGIVPPLHTGAAPYLASPSSALKTSIRVGRKAVQCWDTDNGCAQPARSVYPIFWSMQGTIRLACFREILGNRKQDGRTGIRTQFIPDASPKVNHSATSLGWRWAYRGVLRDVPFNKAAAHLRKRSRGFSIILRQGREIRERKNEEARGRGGAHSQPPWRFRTPSCFDIFIKGGHPPLRNLTGGNGLQATPSASHEQTQPNSQPVAAAMSWRWLSTVRPSAVLFTTRRRAGVRPSFMSPPALNTRREFTNLTPFPKRRSACGLALIAAVCRFSCLGLVCSLVVHYFEGRRNASQVEQQYRERYPDKTPPSRRMFSRLFVKLCEMGNLNPQTRACEAAEVTVLAAVAVDPHVSTRQPEAEIGILKMIAHRILKRHTFHPYHVHLHQELHGIDFQNHVEFYQWAQRQIIVNSNFFSVVLFADESSFSNSGQVNTRNMQYWVIENSRWFRQLDHQCHWKVNVRCGMVGNNRSDYSLLLRFPAGSLMVFRTWESCRMMSLVSGFSRDLSFPPPFYSGAAPYSPHFALIGSYDLPNMIETATKLMENPGSLRLLLDNHSSHIGSPVLYLCKASAARISTYNAKKTLRWGKGGDDLPESMDWLPPPQVYTQFSISTTLLHDTTNCLPHLMHCLKQSAQCLSRYAFLQEQCDTMRSCCQTAPRLAAAAKTHNENIPPGLNEKLVVSNETQFAPHFVLLVPEVGVRRGKEGGDAGSDVWCQAILAENCTLLPSRQNLRRTEYVQPASDHSRSSALSGRTDATNHSTRLSSTTAILDAGNQDLEPITFNNFGTETRENVYKSQQEFWLPTATVILDADDLDSMTLNDLEKTNSIKKT
ncbi:hypothetical protein PR048_003121 [Dryococelus australis]|uniref:DUF4817 domain-containing protein n=1 Tax=Dryococelus australis TaxID=614101 RepID=A0ABQ9IN54_9NEOP|nr:hypothetical protein PR048_003121 [Dryococelus australis]